MSLRTELNGNMSSVHKPVGIRRGRLLLLLLSVVASGVSSWYKEAPAKLGNMRELLLVLLLALMSDAARSSDDEETQRTTAMATSINAEKFIAMSISFSKMMAVFFL